MLSIWHTVLGFIINTTATTSTTPLDFICIASTHSVSVYGVPTQC